MVYKKDQLIMKKEERKYVH